MAENEENTEVLETRLSRIIKINGFFKDKYFYIYGLIFVPHTFKTFQIQEFCIFLKCSVPVLYYPSCYEVTMCSLTLTSLFSNLNPALVLLHRRTVYSLPFYSYILHI